MKRTRRRPLPSGRITLPHAATWATSVGLAGTALLATKVTGQIAHHLSIVIRPSSCQFPMTMSQYAYFVLYGQGCCRLISWQLVLQLQI